MGPVSRLLVEQVTKTASQKGLVLWLDARGDYAALADALADASSARAVPVVPFRGSFVELMLALEGRIDGVDQVPLIVYLPGYNQESVRQTPALELFRAGTKFERALSRIVTDAAAGRVPPEAITAFLAGDDVTLAAADAWLEQAAIRLEGGLAARLDAMTPSMLVDDLMDRREVAGKMAGAEADAQTVWEHLHRRFGLDADWRRMCRERGDAPHDHALRAWVGWAQCVEFVHDLRRAPVDARLTRLRALPKAVVEACGQVLAHLRRGDRHDPEGRRRDALYEQVAADFGARFAAEFEQGEPESLGRIDTFPEEEARLYAESLKALGQARWDTAAQWAADRLRPDAYWVQRDLARHRAWRLVAAAATLGRALDAAPEPLKNVHGVDAAAERYAKAAWPVDRAHRLLEQARADVLGPDLPRSIALRGALDAVRDRHRVWADALAVAFARLCEEHGFLPADNLRQRSLFDRVVRPLASGPGPVALFMVDALRFEMGAALHEKLAAEGDTQADLRPNLCELPSVTEVGMNALAPVVRDGRLHPTLTAKGFAGFETGEFRVFDPDTRRKAMGARVGDPECERWTLEQLLDKKPGELKKAVAKAKLLVITADEIDRAGEKDVGLRVFESALRDLYTAWQILREAEVKRFVFTADHGFLLLDRAKAHEIEFGVRGDAARRYALYPQGVRTPEQVSVQLDALGYAGASQHLVLARTTALFAQKKRRPTFVHGGNSLQERVIPVLTVTHSHAVGGETERYVVQAQRGAPMLNLHRLTLRVSLAPGQNAPLAFGGPQAIDLVLRVAEREDVSVALEGVSGAARLEGNAITVKVDQAAEVFFRLSGPVEDRVRVELAHPRNDARVQSMSPVERFLVEGPPPRPITAPPPAIAPEAADEVSEGPSASQSISDGTDWLETIEDAGHRKVLQDLALYGVVTESDVYVRLGNARAARRFAAALDRLLPRIPFRVRVESGAEGKRYVREGDAG